MEKGGTTDGDSREGKVVKTEGDTLSIDYF